MREVAAVNRIIDKRGGDHTTNGIRMGLDGWIYIAIGDYGWPEARSKDGGRVTMRGGISRVRQRNTSVRRRRRISLRLRLHLL